MTLTFTELLNANGIEKPTKPTHLILLFFYERQLHRFHKKWDPVEHSYINLQKRYINRKQSWDFCNEQLLKNWNTEMPPMEEIELSFKTPDEAFRVIRTAYKKLTKYNPFFIMTSLENSAREAWIKEVITSAPKECRLIIFKNNSCRPQTSKIEEFEQAIKNNQSTQIGYNPIWIAITPEAEISARAWEIDKTSSSVEYVTE